MVREARDDTIGTYECRASSIVGIAVDTAEVKFAGWRERRLAVAEFCCLQWHRKSQSKKAPRSSAAAARCR